MGTKEKKGIKKGILIPLIVIGAILLIIIGYVIYVFSSYHRIPDNLAIEPCNSASNAVVEPGREYKSISYNTGFAAYVHDFNFFMDGGSKSWANSLNGVISTVQDITRQLNSYNADFVSLQEVDTNSTRTYYVNQEMMYRNVLKQYNNVSAAYWDSPYLFWPVYQPHGFCRTSMMTMSKFAATSAVRRSFEIDQGFTKIVDMDRGYTAARYPTSNGHELVYYTTHMSAYSSDPSTALKQTEMLVSDMKNERDKGNYCVCGADFNKDVTVGSSIYVKGVSAGESGFPVRYLEGSGISLVNCFDPNNPVPTCRDAGVNYDQCSDISFFSFIDGFLVSDNVEVISKRVIDENFVNSDHNPVEMIFMLR